MNDLTQSQIPSSAYVNFHTHYMENSKNNYWVLNLDLPRWWEKPVEEIFTFIDQKSLSPFFYFTVGVHPWWISNSITSSEKMLDKVEKVLQQKASSFLALGEIGLDRSPLWKGLWEEQVSLFRQQVLLAKKYQVKNLLLHCVKAYEDIRMILSEESFQGQVIFHDYNGSEAMTKKFLLPSQAAGKGAVAFKTYFSLGRNFHRHHHRKSKIQQESHLALLPLERIFLETDDDEQLSIEQIYQNFYLRCQGLLLTSKVLTFSEIQHQLQQNFLSLITNRIG